MTSPIDPTKEIQELKAKIGVLEAKIGVLDAEKADLKAKRDALQSELTKVTDKDEKDRLTNQITVISTEITAIDNQITAINNQITELYKHIPIPQSASAQATAATTRITLSEHGTPTLLDQFNPWYGSVPPSVTSEVKDEVKEVCAFECPITGVNDKLCKVAHIIPKRCMKNLQLLKMLDWKECQVNEAPNLILLEAKLEEWFDHLAFCFVPCSTPPEGLCPKCNSIHKQEKDKKGNLICTYKDSKGNSLRFEPFEVREFQMGWGYDGKVVCLPSFVSRRALFVNAWFCHQKYGKLADMPQPMAYQTGPRSTSPPDHIKKFLDGLVLPSGNSDSEKEVKQE